MEADLKESDSNLLNMTKQLDNANAAQKVAAEALEAANKERSGCWKKPSLEKRRSRVCGKSWPILRKAKRKPRMERKRVGQQEVLTVLRNDHPEFDVKNLEVRFPPPDAEGEEDS
ncbi:hypothetical protein Adt_28277 [Abeliophyllum distichum]|uniref:Uncharacterized protein n=1 Tax=Abeliophyllum distichum TaxID=126358 RepID=A0ABD1RW44_9LAMI